MLFEIVNAVSSILIFIFAVLLWIWAFVYPAVQAISLTRWYTACMNHIGEDLSLYSKWRIFTSYYEIFGGISSKSVSNQFGRWDGIGAWQIYKDPD